MARCTFTSPLFAVLENQISATKLIFASRKHGKEDGALKDSTTTTSWSSSDCCVSHMTKPAPQQKRRWLRYEDDRVDFLN